MIQMETREFKIGKKDVLDGLLDEEKIYKTIAMLDEAKTKTQIQNQIISRTG